MVRALRSLLLLLVCSGTLGGCASALAKGSPPSSEDEAMPAIDEVVAVSLTAEQEQTVPGTELRLWISSSSSKHGAPVSSVSVMFAIESERRARILSTIRRICCCREVGALERANAFDEVLAESAWTIEEGRFSSEWLAGEGRFWHPQLERYVEGSLPDWLVRLDSVDETSVSGAPTAVTVSVRRHTLPETAP